MAEIPDDDSITAIREIFVAALPGRLQKIQESLAGRDLAAARYVVHQLRGTGAGFGLPELTGAAGRAEDALSEYDTGPTEALWRQIQAAVAEIESVCRRAQGKGIDST